MSLMRALARCRMQPLIALLNGKLGAELHLAAKHAGDLEARLSTDTNRALNGIYGGSLCGYLHDLAYGVGGRRS